MTFVVGRSLRAAVVAFADQVSKSAVVAVLGDGDWSSGPLRLTVVRNPGGPFGLRSRPGPGSVDGDTRADAPL